MRTLLVPAAAAGRNELTAILVPEGGKPSLPATAPATATWNADFGKDKGASVLLRGSSGQRWLLLRVAKKPTADEVREAAGQARLQAETL
ncbi:MAG: hypothetical protein ISR76_00820, partial [Planctomycetes bacterium]|nr:hypothetical protein [Planctomycetota bacterium]